IFAVRQLIAKEMIQLKALPTVDKVGILSQLDAAQSSVDSLRIQTKSNIESDEKPSPANASGSNWRNQVDRSINLLEKLIVVRRNDENIEPLVSPLLESALRENIRLNFQEAQWAVINNNSVVYLFALTQAEKNLKRTFNTQNTTVLLKQVNELQQIKLGVEKPKEQLALPALNQVIDNKELLGDEGSDTKKGVKGQ
ncbi:MAG: hemX, partial [Gammaproteobacteria bacterium]|nr:hemX [Gammaproteobacteria bacterium]